MKNSLLLLLFMVLILSGCEKEQVDSQLDSNLVLEMPSPEEKEANLNAILEKISALSEKEQKSVTVTLKYGVGGLLETDDLQINQFDAAVRGIVSGVMQENFEQTRGWEITCHNADGSTTTTTCGTHDSDCMSQAVTACLNSGGCTTICPDMKITYYPSVLK